MNVIIYVGTRASREVGSDILLPTELICIGFFAHRLLISSFVCSSSMFIVLVVWWFKCGYACRRLCVEMELCMCGSLKLCCFSNWSSRKVGVESFKIVLCYDWVLEHSFNSTIPWTLYYVIVRSLNTRFRVEPDECFMIRVQPNAKFRPNCANTDKGSNMKVQRAII